MNALVLLVLLADPPRRAMVGVQVAVAGKAGEIVVQAVIPDGPAEKAGLRGGDLILSIDGTRFATLQGAVDYIRALKPGKKAVFRVRRGDKEKDIPVIPKEA
ncbi:MAG: PDZ domain-containing protein [Gemmataceae bacterium]|nr:PDZ domain-containing protein [Gemmataceae bacterium]